MAKNSIHIQLLIKRISHQKSGVKFLMHSTSIQFNILTSDTHVDEITYNICIRPIFPRNSHTVYVLHIYIYQRAHLHSQSVRYMMPFSFENFAVLFHFVFIFIVHLTWCIVHRNIILVAIADILFNTFVYEICVQMIQLRCMFFANEHEILKLNQNDKIN